MKKLNFRRIKKMTLTKFVKMADSVGLHLEDIIGMESEQLDMIILECKNHAEFIKKLKRIGMTEFQIGFIIAYANYDNENVESIPKNELTYLG